MSQEKNALEKALDGARDTIKSATDDLIILSQLDRQLFGIEQLDDVSAVYAYQYKSSGQTEVTFHLKQSAKDSKLVHKLAQRFSIKFEKSPSWDGSSLTATGKNAAWRFVIKGYVPQTCALIPIETPLTEEELQAARDAVPTVRKSFKVVCVDEEKK